MEYLDIVNERNELLGFFKEKEKAHRDGNYHRTAHIWLINRNKELLLQLRSPNKASFPNCWDISAAGHINHGESVIEGGLRELKEELGVTAKPEDLQFVTIVRFGKETNSEFGFVYLMETDLKEEDFFFADHEVAEVKYIYYTDLEEMVMSKQDNLLIHNNEEEILFEYIRNNIDKN